MRIKQGFKLRTVGGEYIVTAESVQHIDFNKLITLNASAAYLWQQVEGKEFDQQTLANLLEERYDVDAEEALCDATDIAKDWTEAGLTEA